MTDDPMTLIPWVEANQGLISVVALGAALAVAVLEYIRANAVEEGRDSRFRSTVSALLANLSGKAEEGLALLGQSTVQRFDGNAGFRIWRAEANMTFEAIRALRPAAPPDPSVILLLVEIEDELNPERGEQHEHSTTDAISALQRRLAANEAIRERFVALKRRSD